ncbi:serine/threonine-protein kinase [Actinocorallia longicatena]|uniref:non-specific serine/threonine protein kinase n=1 Tax=Actinocorallia longicatena TaxID=111803 RepID=A0ABP6QHI2_9ACTN
MNPPEDRSAALTGRMIGPYQVLDLIGRGGMAEVYMARDQRLGRVVALKILAPHLAYDERFRLRFVRESRTVAGMDHPYIIPIFEAGEADGLLFIAMRYVSGLDLRELMTRSGILPPDRACALLGQIASALDSAHETGLVHRDVKPANVLISGGGSDSGEHPEHVYLTDFGLTKSASSLSGLTSQGQFVGTPRYISPEQIRGEQVDGRCDQYALANVAYEMLAGTAPFHRESQLALIYAHVQDEPPTLTSHRPDLPPAVDGVFGRALAKHPAARYGTCREFVLELRAALGEPVSDPRLRSFPPMHVPQQYRPTADTVPPISRGSTIIQRTTAGRKPWRLIGAAVAAAVALLAGAALFFQGGGTARYPGSAAAPFSFPYPQAWKASTHSDVFAVASPEAPKFEALFQTPVSADWSGVAKLGGGSSVGVFARVSDTLNTAPDKNLQYLLPGTVTLGAGVPTTAGGHQATRFQGSVADPQQSSRLDLTALVIQRGSSPAALLVYFCAPGHCDTSYAGELETDLAFTG